MKRNKLFIGSSGLLVMAAVFALSKWGFDSKGHYSQNALNALQEKSSDDAQAWLKARYVDKVTGMPIATEKLEQIRTQIAKMDRNKSIIFEEQGPDNIGGRTRAIQIDRTNINRVWAGGVSGGLFVSNNKGNAWERVDSYMNSNASPFISSMTQTTDGVLYVATGSLAENWDGNGVWYSTDFGATWAKVPGSANCNEISSSNANNYAWLATSTGLKKWKVGDASLTNVTIASGACSNFQISKDGQVLVAAIGSNKTYVSTDGGSTWTDKSGSGAGVVPSGAARIEYAISNTRTGGNYSLYAVRTSSNLLGMHVSQDNGATWSQFVGASGTPSNLDIYRNQGTYNSIVSVAPNNNQRILIGGIDVWQWQQTVNNPPSGGFEKISQWFVPRYNSRYVHADNHEMKWDAENRLYIGNDGGIGISTNLGQTFYPANRGYNVTQFYGIAFDKDGSVMGGAQDNGTLYNDHSLSSYKEFTEVNGGDGFACEISFFNPKVMFSSVYYNGISRSGDKGVTWSSFSPTFPSSYAPAGTEGSIHPFVTSYILAEYYDLNSEDSVIYRPNKDYPAGAKIKIPSLATGDSMLYTTTKALYYDDTVNFDPSLTITDVSVVNAINGQTVFLGNYTYTPFASATNTVPPTIGDSLLVDFPTGPDTVVVESLGTYLHYFVKNPSTGANYSLGNEKVAYNIAWDTLTVQDPFQSWMVVYVNTNGGELWGTRNATRFSVLNPLWIKLAQGIGSTFGGSNDHFRVDMEFSKDLNHLYVVAGGGVYRIDGLGSIYTSDPNFKSKAGFTGSPTPTIPPTATSKLLINATSHEGLAVNPSNPDDVVLFGGFGSTNKRSLNATSGSPTFTNLTNITSPSNVATYDGIIDRDDADIIVVGTAEGVFVTENGGATWSNASAGFERTPVFHVRQSWRTWDEGNRRPGEIYIGTYGRGIWSSAAYLGIDENGKAAQNFKTKLKTYPNPANDHTTLTFNIDETTDVMVNVYNISGKLVKTISTKNMHSGAHTLKIDTENLPVGAYIVKFVAGKQNETVKFVKM